MYFFGSVLVGILTIYWCLGPVGTMSGDFNSDAAIPVIMANAEFLSPFHLYYFGQDRLGGWPYILMWMMAQLFSISISPVAVFLAQGLLFATLTYGATTSIFPRIPAAGLLLIAATAWIPVVRQFFYEINNPYCIQLALCLVFWALRIRMREYRSWVGYLLLLGIAVLAIWTSPASILFLVIIHSCERLPSEFKSFSAVGKLVYLGVPVFAYLVHSLIHVIYLHYVDENFSFALQHLHFRVESNAHIKFSDLWSNFSSGVAQVHQHFNLWLPIALILVVYVTGLLQRWPRGDQVFFRRIGILCLIIISSTIVLSMVNWVRIHHHSVRYHTPQIVLLGYLCILAVSHLLGKLHHQAPRFIPLLILVPLFFSTSSLEERHHRYADLQEKADLMVDPIGKTVVMGAYWDTYLWQGLRPNHLIAVPLESHGRRIPWDYQTLLADPPPSVVSCFDLDDTVQFGKRLVQTVESKVQESCTYKGYKVVAQSKTAHPQ